MKTERQYLKPPRYDRLSFFYYSSRLRAELADPIMKRVERILQENFSNADLVGGWIALKAERNGGGFIAGASWFADDNEQNENVDGDDINLIGDYELVAKSSLSHSEVFQYAMQTGYLVSLLEQKLTEVDEYQSLPPTVQEKILRDICKEHLTVTVEQVEKSANYDDVVKKYVGEVVSRLLDMIATALKVILDDDWKLEAISVLSNKMCDAYAAPLWGQGYAGQLAADRVNTKPEKLSEILRSMKRGGFETRSHFVPPDTHPRDVVMNDRVIGVVVARANKWYQKRFRGEDGSPQDDRSENPSLVCIADEKRGPITCRFLADLDFTARFMLEVVQNQNPDKVAVLTLVPVAERKHGPAIAVLALLSIVDSETATTIYPILDLKVSLLNFYPQDNQVKQLAAALLKLSRDIARTLPLLESIEALSEVFLSGETAIKNAVSFFDSHELKGRVEDDASDADEPDILKRLHQRKVEAILSPVSHPLDAFCSDILGFMRELLTQFDWASLVDPLQRFAQQEQLLLGAHEHRDHYLHTLKVFLLGRRVLIRADKYSFHDGNNEFIRQRWALAALLHDTCHPIQKAEDWLGEYIQRLVHKGVIGEISTRPFLESWRGKAYEQCWFDALIRLVDHRLNSWLSTSDNRKFTRRFQAAVLFNLLEERNHAVLGAMGLLLGACHEYPDLTGPIKDVLEIQSDAWRETTERNARIAAIFDAATAIILHDPNVWEAMTTGYDDVYFAPPTDLVPEERVVAEITWVLAVADVIQEWGRDLNLGAEIRREDQEDYIWRIPSKVVISSRKSPLKIKLMYRREFAQRVEDLAKTAFNEVRQCIDDAGLNLNECACTNLNYVCDDMVRPSHLTGPTRTWPDHSATLETWQNLSVIASAWDLLGEKTSPDTHLWYKALGRFLNDTKRKTVINYVRRGMSGQLRFMKKWNRDRLVQQFTGAIRRRKANGISLLTKNDLANLRRMHGLWRIPYSATVFWKAPSKELSLTVNRGVEGIGDDAVDVLVFEPPS